MDIKEGFIVFHRLFVGPGSVERIFKDASGRVLAEVCWHSMDFARGTHALQNLSRNPVPLDRSVP